MITGAIFFYFSPILLGTLLLIFWRNMTESKNGFPTKFHILLYFILSLIPFLGFVLWLFLTVYYLVERILGEITIKTNKFTKFWFDKNE